MKRKAIIGSALAVLALAVPASSAMALGPQPVPESHVEETPNGPIWVPNGPLEGTGTTEDGMPYGWSISPCVYADTQAAYAPFETEVPHFDWCFHEPGYLGGDAPAAAKTSGHAKPKAKGKHVKKSHAKKAAAGGKRG
ncbi:MAG TPA: hypothetical protein VFX45_02040 [Solirubrobacterales bacterium]|nr:hypothetical protein [Solirubrobacterales bacterium]